MRLILICGYSYAVQIVEYGFDVNETPDRQ